MRYINSDSININLPLGTFSNDQMIQVNILK